MVCTFYWFLMKEKKLVHLDNLLSLRYVVAVHNKLKQTINHKPKLEAKLQNKTKLITVWAKKKLKANRFRWVFYMRNISLLFVYLQNSSILQCSKALQAVFAQCAFLLYVYFSSIYSVAYSFKIIRYGYMARQMRKRRESNSSVFNVCERPRFITILLYCMYMVSVRKGEYPLLNKQIINGLRFRLSITKRLNAVWRYNIYYLWD